MKVTGAGFPDTVRELGQKCGVEVAEARVGVPDRQGALLNRIEHVNSCAANWFQKNLMDPSGGKEGSAYLLGRGIHAQSIQSFRIGFAPEGWDGLLRALTREGYSPSELATAGLVVAKEHGSSTAVRHRWVLSSLSRQGHVSNHRPPEAHYCVRRPYDRRRNSQVSEFSRYPAL